MPKLQDAAPSARLRLVALTTIVGLLAGGCVGGASQSIPAATPMASTLPTPADTATPEPGLVVGGDRPVTVHVPSSYDANQPAPLLIVLHGYSGTGPGVDEYFHLASAADARGYVTAYPDGTTDSSGNQFWNATDACCSFSTTGVDDVAYLTSLIAEIRATLAIDPKRIALVGHSNGGFMAHRMACDQAGLVAVIVSVAGATFADRSDCAPGEPVSVAQVHGTADDTIEFGGGRLSGVPYPGARMTAEAWAAYDGCDEAALPLNARVDVDATLTDGPDPAEASIEAWSGCRSGAVVQLWTVPMGGHVPLISASFGDAVMDFLADHPKP
jgi:polyhydroxybutyrate depolymerase